MKSKWEPGTRVRVIDPAPVELVGLVGVIEDVSYAKTEEATSVLIDTDSSGFQAPGAFFWDNELEAV